MKLFGHMETVCLRSASLFVVSAAIGLSTSAVAQTAGPLLRITGESIFSNCTADHVASQPGIVHLNTVVEPNIALNPASGGMLIGVQQDRWSNGGSRGLRGEYSKDGGRSWNVTSTPNVTECQLGPWPRASDPWVTFSPDGTAYFSSLVTETVANPNIFGHNGQTVSRSTDGGATWQPPTTLIDTPRQPDATKPQILNDKNSITADPNTSKVVYAVWDQLISYTPGAGVGDTAAPAPGSGDVASITRRLKQRALKLHTLATVPNYPTFVRGPTLFSRTVNAGYTWETPRVIYDPGNNYQTIANQIVALPKGVIADFFTRQNDLTGADQIGLVESYDRGTTWGPAILPLDLVNNPAVTPNLQQGIRSADILFSVAVDVPNSLIYVVWEDTRFTGDNEIAFAYSIDGQQWTTPIRVNQTPRKPGYPLFQQALIPSVATTADGTVVVTYFDFRNDKVGATGDNADVWAVFCNPLKSADGCTSTSDWSTELRLTNNSFNFDYAPDAEGHFLGDYMGLKGSGNSVQAAFTASNQSNLTFLYTRKITVP